MCCSLVCCCSFSCLLCLCAHISNPTELFFSVLTFGPALDDEAEEAEREEKQVSEVCLLMYKNMALCTKLVPPPITQSDVATLVSMGWEETASREALRASGGVEAAIELLISRLS